MNFSLGLSLVLLACCLSPVFTSPSDVTTSRDKRLVCRTCKELTLSSQPNGARNIFPIAGASEVLRVELISQISAPLCIEGISYGAYGPTVWVSDRCIGEFKVCYQEGYITEIRCESTRFEPETCETTCEKIGSVAVKDQLSIFYSCERDLTYTIIDTSVNALFDCRAEFYVGCQKCRLSSDEGDADEADIIAEDTEVEVVEDTKVEVNAKVD